ncbi:MAG TPA: S9 family peptidase, partial [Thermoflexales bacterium]|nr:S9 family peptidase [Thermoflexales bacterium]
VSVISPDSIYDLITLEDVRLSPDGRFAAFTRVAVDKAGNRYKRTLWLKDLSSDAPAMPLSNGVKDSAPRWREDGDWLGFLSGRDGPPAVYALPMRGGEAQLVASHPNGIAEFDWSPGGTRIAFAASLRADERAREDEGVAPPPADPKAPDRNDPRVLTRLPFRTGTTYTEDKFRHLYVADMPPVPGEGEPPKPRRVTDGELSFEGPAWSRDGKSLLSCASRDPDSGNLFLFIDAVRISLDEAETGALSLSKGPEDQRPVFPVERLTGPGETIHNATPSPDGRWIAFMRRNEEHAMFKSFRLAMIPVAGGEAVDLAPGFVGDIAGLRWAADSASIVFLAEGLGASNLHRATLDGAQATALTETTHDIKYFDVAADGRIVFIASTEADPAVLFIRDTSGAIRPIYTPNRIALSAGVATVEKITYRSDEFDIEGWIVKPADFDPARQYPLILQIHGGPAVMWGPATQSMWIELQAMAAAGYVIFLCNPRGSGGYGERFQGANRGDWGDGPARDVLRGVDLVVARGYIDPKRLCITGGSYGGYLTAWILGHDQRFAAACAQRGVFNLISFRGTTDITFFSDMEMGVTPWDDIGKLWEQSPLKHAPNIETPLLLEHSEQDYRVAIEQAEQLFVTLRERRKTVELVRWPREGHELSRAGEPRHRVERIRRIIAWFDRYAAVAPPAAQP